MLSPQFPPTSSPTLRHRLHEIIFESDTPAGKAFDVVLLLLIALSVVAVMLESVESLSVRFHHWFVAIEWTFTILFTIEYLLRLYSVWKPWQYARSFFGLIDLMAILPTYLSLIFVGAHYLLVIRALRLLRVFRIFKLGHFIKEGEIIVAALRASRPKITVFLTFIVLLVIIIGSVMYLVEGGRNPSFANIPKSMYWAVVTLTTVGYGDITPQTGLGQFLSAIVMIMGYAIIAVPTGIVSAEFMDQRRAKPGPISNQACPSCGQDGHDADAVHCKFCGYALH